MVDRAGDGAPRPPPRDWLPHPTAPESAPEWQNRLERIVAAAEPALRRLGERGSDVELTWPAMLGRWWKPAVAMAAAAVALLLVLHPRNATREAGDGLPLSVVAAEGEPVALWEGLGIEADPVLALIALQQEAQ